MKKHALVVQNILCCSKYNFFEEKKIHPQPHCVRCSMTLYLKGYQKYDMSELKVQLSLSIFRLLKGLRYGKDGSRRLSCGSTFNICQGISKN